MTAEDLIAGSSVAAVVSDPSQPDNPIIACNAAFRALTGYEDAEIIGRNCRFLRGGGTEPDATARLRAAVVAGTAALVELTNYRKGGAPFRNAVMIAPIFDADGTLLYFLGSQMEVGAPGQDRAGQARAAVSRLSPRQREILAAMTAGQLNKQIAFALNLSERTIKMHRAALLRGLGVRTSAEAMRIAIEAGL